MTALAGQQDRVEAEGVLDRSEVWWLRLREIIRTGSLKPGDFVLSSGHTSTFFISAPADARLPASAARRRLDRLGHRRRKPCERFSGRCFFVRTAQNEHGAGEC